MNTKNNKYTIVNFKNLTNSLKKIISLNNENYNNFFYIKDIEYKDECLNKKNNIKFSITKKNNIVNITSIGSSFGNFENLKIEINLSKKTAYLVSLNESKCLRGRDYMEICKKIVKIFNVKKITLKDDSEINNYINIKNKTNGIIKKEKIFSFPYSLLALIRFKETYYGQFGFKPYSKNGYNLENLLKNRIDKLYNISWSEFDKIFGEGLKLLKIIENKNRDIKINDIKNKFKFFLENSSTFSYSNINGVSFTNILNKNDQNIIKNNKSAIENGNFKRIQPNIQYNFGLKKNYNFPNFPNYISQINYDLLYSNIKNLKFEQNINPKDKNSQNNMSNANYNKLLNNNIVINNNNNTLFTLSRQYHTDLLDLWTKYWKKIIKSYNFLKKNYKSHICTSPFIAIKKYYTRDKKIKFLSWLEIYSIKFTTFKSIKKYSFYDNYTNNLTKIIDIPCIEIIDEIFDILKNVIWIYYLPK